MKLIIKDRIRLVDLKNGSLFLTSDLKNIGLKTEYCTDELGIDAYLVGSGEKFWGGTDNARDQANVEVYELEVVTEDLVENPILYIEPDMRDAFYTGFNRGIYVASVINRRPIDGEYSTYEQYIENKNNLKK